MVREHTKARGRSFAFYLDQLFWPLEDIVEVFRRDGSVWDRAVTIERVGLDEWTVEYDDGEQAWRDHHEQRPASTSTAS